MTTSQTPAAPSPELPAERARLVEEAKRLIADSCPIEAANTIIAAIDALAALPAPTPPADRAELAAEAKRCAAASRNALNRQLTGCGSPEASGRADLALDAAIDVLAAAPVQAAQGVAVGLYTGHVCPSCGRPSGDGHYLAAPVTQQEPLGEALERFRQAVIARGRPVYGKPGTRDVDVAADQRLYDAALAAQPQPKPLSAIAAPAPQAVAADERNSELSREPDGNIAIDWCTDDRQMLSMSLSREGRLAVAVSAAGVTDSCTAQIPAASFHVLDVLLAATLMANGLTEAETSATASVAGLAGAVGVELPTIKGATIHNGYVIVTPAGWGDDKAVAVKAAILSLFPVNPAFTPNPDGPAKAASTRAGE